MMTNTVKQQKMKDASFVGSTDLIDVTANELSVMGPLKFNNITVTGDTDILGPVQDSQNGSFKDISILGSFQADDVICRDLDVAGSVSVRGLTVTGDASIFGTLEMEAPQNGKGSNALQNLEISSESITLEDTFVSGNITIQSTLKNKALKWFNNDRNQLLHLEGKTIVKGTITFKSGKGKVILGSSAKVEGAIVGGIVEKA